MFNHPLIPINEIAEAQERGRLLAAKAMADHPEQRKRVEDVYGIEYCKKKYPEVYSRSPFFKRIIDRLRHVTF